MQTENVATCLNEPSIYPLKNDITKISDIFLTMCLKNVTYFCNVIYKCKCQKNVTYFCNVIYKCKCQKNVTYFCNVFYKCKCQKNVTYFYNVIYKCKCKKMPLIFVMSFLNLKSTLNISKSKSISNYSYLTVKCLVRGNFR